MQAVLVLLQMEPEKKNDPDTPAKMIDDWYTHTHTHTHT